MTRSRVFKAAATRSFVACEVGETSYALPVEQVQEILQPLNLTPLPHAPAGIVGAVEYRNEVVPILDLGQQLGYGETVAKRRKWVLIQGGGKTVGVIVAHVAEVFEFVKDDLRSAPELGNAAARAASHVLNYQGKISFVLDVEAIAKLAEMPLNEGVDS